MYQGSQTVCSTLQGDASAFSGHRGLRFLLCYGLHCGCREGPHPYKSTCGDSRCAGLCDDGCLWHALCCLLPPGRQACPSPAGPVTAEAIFHNREEVAVKVSISSSGVKLLALWEAPQLSMAVQALWLDPVHDFGFFRFGSRGTLNCVALQLVWISCQAKPYFYTPAGSILQESNSRSWRRSPCTLREQRLAWKSGWW